MEDCFRYKDGKKMIAHKGDLLCGVCHMNVAYGIDVYEGRDYGNWSL